MNEAPKRRRWFAYSLRTLLVLITILAVWLGIMTQRARHQRSVINAVAERGGKIRYDFQNSASGEPNAPKWLRRLIGDEYFQEIVLINMQGAKKFTDDQLLEQIGGLRKLEELSIGGKSGSELADFTDDGLRHVGHLRSLKALDIGFSHTSDRGTEHLSDLSELLCFRLDVTSISDEGLRSLKPLTKLYTLSLFGTNITNHGMEHLSQLTSLGELDLANTQITDDGLKYLSRLPNLNWLRLDQNSVFVGTPPRITDAGVRLLVDLPNLQDLGLVNLGITDASIECLASFKKLQAVSLFNFDPAYTPESVKELKKKRPTLKIRDL